MTKEEYEEKYLQIAARCKSSPRRSVNNGRLRCQKTLLSGKVWSNLEISIWLWKRLEKKRICCPSE